MFVERLIDRIRELNNPTVAGLDPKLDYIPLYIRNEAASGAATVQKAAADAILRFNKELIDALHDIVPAVKPQLAYYEMHGLEGLRAFDETVKYAKSKGMLVIADGKRNDIGSTAEAYSAAFLGRTDFGRGAETVFDADALTVNPYLGIDGIKPFIEDCSKYGKGIFILVKTSNKSSGQLQDLVMQDGRHIYEVVAGLVDEWGQAVTGKYGYNSVGAVVGATYPEQAKALRKIMKNAYILVPGYGAQGGTAKDAAACFNEDGLGAIVNASRSMMCAHKSERWSGTYTEKDFAAAARAEAIRMRDELNAAISAGKGGNA
jgi:orotidine-5'-phosphate decarboxylase